MQRIFYLLFGTLILLLSFSIFKQIESVKLKTKIDSLQSMYEHSQIELADAERKLENVKSKLEDLDTQAENLQSDVENLKFNRSTYAIEDANDNADQLQSDIQDAENEAED